MKQLALALLLLTLAAGVRAEPVPAAGSGGNVVNDAQLLRRVELLLERSEAERLRLEGELLQREQRLRADYAARLTELERQLAAARRPATAPAEEELAYLRRQVAELTRAMPGGMEQSYGALREENAKLAGELQRLMLTPTWPPVVALSLPPGGADLLDVNRATREQLRAVPGMTAAAADFIVWYRTRVGPFSEIAELRFLPDATPELFGQWRRLLRAE